MRFLVDECTGPLVAAWLRSQGHDAASVYNDAKGTSDRNVLAWAYTEDRILITNDKDFGERVYRDQLPHRGVILLRLQDERAAVVKVSILQRLLMTFERQLPGRFTVASETQVRFGE